MPDSQLVKLDRKELNVICEAMWHALHRADLPYEDHDCLRKLRERLNCLRNED